MSLNEVTYTNALPVGGYGPGYFRIGGKAQNAPLAILPGGVTPWGGLEDAETLLKGAGQVDVLLIGTGAEVAHIPPEFRTALEGAGLGVEIMASAQACRTYNVLLGEGRRVALAVLPL